MQNRRMSHRDVIAHHARVLIPHVTHTQILQIGPTSYPYRRDVAAQHRIEPYTRLLPYLHISHQQSPRCHIHTRAQTRALTLWRFDLVVHGLILKTNPTKIQPQMNGQPPAWLIVQLQDDLNWWVTETAEEPSGSIAPYGVLDPRQLAHVVEVLADYARDGLPESELLSAFHLYTIERELSDGRLRLKRETRANLHTEQPLFALPSTHYDDFLELLGAAHIRRLNRQHHFVRPCTEEEMYEELNLIATDRYFSAQPTHCFDELNQILEWNPAQWND